MSVKVYQLFCERCNYKKISRGECDLIQYAASSIQRTLPELDETGKKIIEAKFMNQPKKFKCPSCGFLIKPKKIADPQKEIDEILQLEEKTK